MTISVLRPLNELRENMEDIASGDGSNNDARLDTNRRDEFGRHHGTDLERHRRADPGTHQVRALQQQLGRDDAGRRLEGHAMPGRPAMQPPQPAQNIGRGDHRLPGEGHLPARGEDTDGGRGRAR